MNKLIVVFVLSAVVAAPAWTASSRSSQPDRPNKEESMGVGAGAAAGAVVGGPIGAIVGAALGGWLGDKFNRERGQRELAEANFAGASAELVSLADLLEGSEAELDALRDRVESQQLSFEQALGEVTEIEVFFHTGAAELDPSVQERLIRLGKVMQLIDNFAVVIEGHADARGDAEYNEQLSAARAAAVRAALIEAGLPAERISARAAGELYSTAAEDDLDALALERKVNLSIVRPETGNRVAAK